nr:uncharacterized protein LOC111424200 [Onthophagus taurus]
MTKRSNVYQESASKKLKLEETNIDALWGEDLNPDDLEDCLLLASQVCEQNTPGPIQRNNVSILPNYSFFQQNDIITSTQTTSNGVSNPLKTKPINSEDLQDEIKKLKTDYTIKEGEITMLREQLKQVRLNLTGEHQKKEKEWMEKIQLINKELLSTKSDLDFKNLEVVNLKHKISEVTKHGDVTLNGILNLSQNVKNKNIRDDDLKLNNYCGELIDYPLRNKIDEDIFKLSKIEHFYDFKLNLNKYNVQDEQKIHQQYKASCEYNHFKFDDLFSSFSVLLNCTQNDLNNDCYTEIIDKIFSSTLQLIKSFLKNLDVLEQDVQEETIRQRDRLYLDLKQEELSKNSSIFGNEEWYKKEIGIKCRRIIAVLSEIVPYSPHLRKSIFQRIDDNDDIFILIKSTIKIIGVLRISEKCTGYLSSVVLFMTKITSTPEFSERHLCVKEIIKEIIFTRPTLKTLEYICEFLKESVFNEDFVQNLCTRTSQRSYSRSSDQLVLRCNEGFIS